MSQQALKVVTIIWKCNKPSATRFPGLVSLCETTVRGVAQTLDKDRAVIR
ncbi:hypothetical protein BDBG_16354 [Blastomyces gilchristii SLH14081]|uniref:Uncharacterized protein n=1 Tax=Blastomyces gilchristii (strain SLH14081) TaxID=559298 RepID=A0A179UA11_BLAGS|nr:uncharacterized protein BDBG_16354 [Blastomyces gilchristii SLH14081]OAT04836.1 hypothetical protein BDBG_16354 [Blastomyces gilchristii SLH14081]